MREIGQMGFAEVVYEVSVEETNISYPFFLILAGILCFSLVLVATVIAVVLIVTRKSNRKRAFAGRCWPALILCRQYKPR